ncbi:hypothetical protein BGY98DRAFT_321163 [Russula aff. rugulosa BPL654]|nr:hypothetical protein BGY98DRAFT_321163 [Russula aff. rugulosa BPL654]
MYSRETDPPAVLTSVPSPTNPLPVALSFHTPILFSTSVLCLCSAHQPPCTDRALPIRASVC